MEVLDFIYICFCYFFVASILMGIVEVIINLSDDKENTEKVRKIYIVIFFVILLLLSTNYDNNRKKYYEKQLREKEKYVNDIIEDAGTLEDVKNTWRDREWEFNDE